MVTIQVFTQMLFVMNNSDMFFNIETKLHLYLFEYTCLLVDCRRLVNVDEKTNLYKDKYFIFIINNGTKSTRRSKT